MKVLKKKKSLLEKLSFSLISKIKKYRAFDGALVNWTPNKMEKNPLRFYKDFEIWKVHWSQYTLDLFLFLIVLNKPIDTIFLKEKKCPHLFSHFFFLSPLLRI